VAPASARDPRATRGARTAAAAARPLLVHVLLSAFAWLVLVPFLWMACAAFKPQQDIFTTPFLPWGRLHDLTLDNFRVLFSREPYARWLINSLFVSSLQTALVVTFSSLGGFALAKYRFAGKRPLMAVMFATLLLPAQVLYPSGGIELVRRLGWVNSYLAVIVPGSVSVFGMFLFMQAMKGVPDELLQAARVDGCSELRLWWEIALPIVRPMIGAYTLLSFLASWNAFLWPQIVLQDESRYTLPLGLSGMIGLAEYETRYGVLMAGTLLAVLPVLALFFVLQRDFIAGLTGGAVKG
jgi:ABC-type glycerol-3-phosphate transport system permease component